MGDVVAEWLARWISRSRHLCLRRGWVNVLCSLGQSTLLSLCPSFSPPPPGVWSIENTGWMGWEGEGVITCHHELASHRTQNRTEPQDSGSSGRYMPQKPG